MLTNASKSTQYNPMSIQSNVNQREGIEKKLSLFPEQRGLKHENDKRGGSN
jgi:hypothetical protein